MEKIKTGNRICPRCGKEFYCSSSSRCWCYEVSLSVEVLEMIENKYETCLCPDCLALLAGDQNQRLLEILKT